MSCFSSVLLPTMLFPHIFAGLMILLHALDNSLSFIFTESSTLMLFHFL